jgi:outer membrane protein assembly factor BamB
MTMRLVSAVLLGTILTPFILEAQTARLNTRPALPSPQALARIGLKERWHVYVPVATSRDGLSFVQVLDGDQVVAQTMAGQLVALNAETGAQQWRVRLGQFHAQRKAIDVNDRIVMAVAGARLHAFDRLTGSMEWQMELPGALSAAPSADNSRLVVCTANGGNYVYALPLPKRELKQGATTRPGQAPAPALTAPTYGSGETDTAAPTHEPHRLWYFKGDAPVTEPPVVTQTHLILATAKGEVYSFQRDERALADVFQSPAPITAPIAQAGESLLVASQDFNLYAFDLALGRLILRWRHTTGSRVLQKPAVAGEDVYVIGQDKGMFCLDRHTGGERWFQPQAVQFVAASRRLVFAVDPLGYLLSLDRRHGHVLDRLDTRDFPILVRNDVTDRVYLGSHDGLILCLQDLSPEHEEPTYHNLQKVDEGMKLKLAKPASKEKKPQEDDAKK